MANIQLNLIQKRYFIHRIFLTGNVSSKRKNHVPLCGGDNCPKPQPPFSLFDCVIYLRGGGGIDANRRDLVKYVNWPRIRPRRKNNGVTDNVVNEFYATPRSINDIGLGSLFQCFDTMSRWFFIPNLIHCRPPAVLAPPLSHTTPPPPHSSVSHPEYSIND